MNRFLPQRTSLRSFWAVALFGTLATVGMFAACGVSAFAQDRPASDAKPADGGPSAEAAPGGGLDETEASLERRYQQFERTLLQMAEYLRKTEPERADLLIRAIGRSKENRISQQMEAITQLLKKEQFGDAIGDQQHLVGDLKGLLELLQSEDRRHQLEKEKEYFELLHKEVSKLAAREKDLRRATERGGNLNRLAERQQGIGKDAQSLLDKINKEDASRNGPDGKPKADRNSNGKNSEKGDQSQSGDKKSDSDKQSGADKKSDADKKSESDKKSGADKNKQADASSKHADSKGNSKDGEKKDKSGEGKNSDAKGDNKQSPDKSQDKKDDKSPLKDGKQPGGQKSQQKGDSKKSQKQQGQGQQNQGEEQGEQGEQQEGSPSEDSQQQDQATPKKTPGRNEIEAARRAMQQAEEELKRLQGKKGMERQDEAIRKLAEARAQLEKILRQLREEEQQIILASLEARFAKMLLMQLQIHVDTISLNKTPTNAWTVKHFGRSRELSVEEDSIAIEAAKALTLLKEEGSSVAFPQGVEQVRDDMQGIARRLSGNDVGEFTQSMERDVIESLEEMVTALQNEIEKRQKENENRRQQKGQRGQSDDEKELVQQLAELKMLRSLQFRVNRRTKQIGGLIRGEEASNEKLLKDLAALARRQAEIQEATYIIATGRNR
ncbi:MAG TPA: hypothetical protein VGP76_17355 [Planctomycetaceae bacterium]|jgi:hypothetical protein|nr:hypothetical protein [Planctomycetaceae bacterium]